MRTPVASYLGEDTRAARFADLTNSPRGMRYRSVERLKVDLSWCDSVDDDCYSTEQEEEEEQGEADAMRANMSISIGEQMKIRMAEAARKAFRGLDIR